MDGGMDYIYSFPLWNLKSTCQLSRQGFYCDLVWWCHAAYSWHNFESLKTCSCRESVQYNDAKPRDIQNPSIAHQIQDPRTGFSSEYWVFLVFLPIQTGIGISVSCVLASCSLAEQVIVKRLGHKLWMKMFTLNINCTSTIR